MAILTPDYERMQNGQSVDFETTKEYRNDFKNQDIGSAQALITSDNNYLVMDADKLNDLCDTINYMQQIWMDDKEEFAEKYFRLTNTPDLYDSSKVYAYGDLVTYNGSPYICISEQVTGSWQDYRWLRIGNDEVGLRFVGEQPSEYVPENGELWVICDGGYLVPTWEACRNDITIDVGETYPNIRYLTPEEVPYVTYDDEIYMTDWNGGEEQ